MTKFLLTSSTAVALVMAASSAYANPINKFNLGDGNQSSPVNERNGNGWR